MIVPVPSTSPVTGAAGTPGSRRAGASERVAGGEQTRQSRGDENAAAAALRHGGMALSRNNRALPCFASETRNNAKS